MRSHVHMAGREVYRGAQELPELQAIESAMNLSSEQRLDLWVEPRGGMSWRSGASRTAKPRCRWRCR
ncbi:hypothetical protein ACOQFL_19595 [Actinopolyspora sp. H202]|uniref:hypothetical protein n=1 Tax=Actinopolyspora sp. H202 TaxID=1500456 RepID=UPI003EE493A2